MTPEQAAALRKPFDAGQIGKLPKLTCKACSKIESRVCDKHGPKKDCRHCGNWISPAHIDLDYVGHAAVTDRLLSVDAGWSWEPAVTDPNTGAPLVNDGGMWIRLTVCGVTRWGWGDGPDPKQRISDAIRNAAMRFGVALDLWSKEDLSHDEEGGGRQADSDSATASARSAIGSETGTAGAGPSPLSVGAQQDDRDSQSPVVLADAEHHELIRHLISGLNDRQMTELLAWWASEGLPSIKKRDALTPEQAKAAEARLEALLEGVPA